MKIIIFTLAINDEEITFKETVYEGDFVKQKNQYVSDNKVIYKNNIFEQDNTIFNQFACTEQEADFLKDNPKLLRHLKHDMIREVKKHVNSKITQLKSLDELLTYCNIDNI